MWEQVPVSWGQDTYRAAMPEGVRELVRMVDYNDVGKLEAAMGEEGEQMAAILLEPVTGTGVFTGRRADRVGRPAGGDRPWQDRSFVATTPGLYGRTPGGHLFEGRRSGRPWSLAWDRIDADFEKHLEEIRNFLLCPTVSASDDMLAGAERVAAMIEGAGGPAEIIPTAETEHAWMDWSDEPLKVRATMWLFRRGSEANIDRVGRTGGSNRGGTNR